MGENFDYYCFEPPAVLSNLNIIDRYTSHGREIRRIREELENLEEKQKAYKNGEISYEPFYRECDSSVFQIMESSEKLDYFIEALQEEDWFYEFQQDVASLFWRLEENRFNEEQNANGLQHRLSNILRHRKQRNSVTQKIHQRLGEMFLHVSSADVIRELEDEMFEARDLACAEYYSTALFVIGRAAEKCLYIIGEERRIEKIEERYSSEREARTIKWEKSGFKRMSEALKEAEADPISGKLIDQKQYSEVQKLISYRNDMAHREHGQLERKRAKVEINSAVQLLEDLSKTVEKLREHDSFEEITQAYRV
ncbi:hypothetical protein [Candidatus Nanohalococcus occultus]|uniref:RiboL-PSP-HEPN domain-containing protein n=1 Tax=Candidatus Nanohalococcus occultus TaxID=2978047 RepID=A0ABY8CDC4_9ARCH|nr:hypothetical protein SVXNc_0188 [Candidatus Nanohaloarchaeota archaeon SVXNc]